MKEQSMKSKIPKWLDVLKLKTAADNQVKENMKLRFSLPIKSHDVISSYKCGACKLQFTFNDVEAQIKKAARTGTPYVECPKCGGVIEAGKVINVPDSQSIIQRALRMTDKNVPPSRSINTWIDKAIYGKLVDNLGRYIERFGISNPQLRFQRGIRTEKFPGEPRSAKGAEFTVEFVDNNNTRNRIVIQAGLTPKGEFIWPRTFKTLSGNEYPLTKLAIEDFTSGKLYTPVTPKHKFPPLNYKQRDITDFRVISADNKKMVKRAVIDDQQLNDIVNQMNITDPTDQQAMKNLLGKYYDPNNPQQFNVGLGVQTQAAPMPTIAEHKFNLKKLAWTYATTEEDVVASILDDISFYPGIIFENTKETDVNKALLEYIQAQIANVYDDAYDSGPDEAVMVAHQIGVDPNTVPMSIEAFKLDEQKIINEVLQQVQSKVSEGKLIIPPQTYSSKINKLNLKKLGVDPNWFTKVAVPEVVNLVNNGLAYNDAYDEAYRIFQDKYGVNLEQPEWDLLWNTSIDTLHKGNISTAVSAIAEKLIKQAENNTVKSLYKTADEVIKEFDLSELSTDENKEWTNSYIDAYNKTLDAGEGIVEASRKAEATADNIIASSRIKLSLRDKQTLVPFVEKDPDYSIAEQTEFSEKRFDIPYNETDGGISDEKDRNYMTMFKGSSVQKKSYVSHEGDKWVVHSESGDVLGKHNTKEEANAQLQAIEISKHKKGSVGQEGGYTLTPAGTRALELLSRGIPVGNYDQQSLIAILGWITGHPQESIENIEEIAAESGLDLGTLRNTFSAAVTDGMVNVPTMGSTHKIEKEGEATGIDLDSEEVGQNPINYSRLKQIVEDLLRAGNIPPTKVDLHALKDGKYSLEDLRDLVETFKVHEDTFYPTTHASFDRDEIIKLAEIKVSDMVKEMPLEQLDKSKDFFETPLEKALEGAAVENPLEEAVEEIVKDEYKGGLEYHELAENPELSPTEVEMAVSHEKDEREHATSLLDLMDRLRETAQKKVDKSSENFQKGINKVADGIVDPYGNPLRSQEPSPEVTPEAVPEVPKSEFQKEPSWRQRSVDIGKLPGESREATPEEKQLFNQLEINKLELEKADTEIKLLRAVLTERHQKELAEYEKGVVSPITTQRQKLYSSMLEATEKLAGLLRESENKYIDIDGRYKAFLTERVTSHTAPVNWQQVVNKIKEKAPELQSLINEIVQGIKEINLTEKQIEQLEFWPAKTKKSADETSMINYMATLYQDVYNNLSELLTTLTSIDQELIAVAS